MLFYWFDRSNGRWIPPDESWRLDVRWRWWLLALCGIGGMMYAAALPPFNMSFLAFFALMPVLFFITIERRWYWNAAAGWFWGWCWAIFSYRFLREIEWFVPWLLAPVMGVFPALWAMGAAKITRVIFHPGLDAIGMDDRRRYLRVGPWTTRMVVMGLAVAALFTTVEYFRSRLFVWNDMSVTQYRNIWFIQLAAITGSYGVGFAVALGNSALWMLFFRRGWRAAIFLAAVIALMSMTGVWYTSSRSDEMKNQPFREWKVLAIQGDLSQRRRPTMAQTAEALSVYERLTLDALDHNPDADIVIWPESAVPILYYSAIDLRYRKLSAEGAIYARYQNIVRRICVTYNKKLLFGALDLAEPQPPLMRSSGMTNSALLTDEWGNVVSRYDKYHRVPFGEYVPGRELLPESWVKALDMGRDLTPGGRIAPLEIMVGERKSDRFVVHPGVVICYEGVFGYLTRTLVRRGADVLVALSNDAWYPESSEPEQHLANATLRAVECGVPMIRVGNNGGTGVVMPDGRFSQVLEVPGPESRAELRRGRGYRMLKVPVVTTMLPTAYIRFGEWFPILLTAFSLSTLVYALMRPTSALNELLEYQDEDKNLELWR